MKRYRSQSALRTLERRTAGRGSSWSRNEYPTPTASRYGTGQNGDPHDGRGQYATRGNPSLRTWAKRIGWPTPTAGDAKRSGSRNTQSSSAKLGLSLTDAVLTGGSDGRRARSTTKDGQSGSVVADLNPLFVEALQGLPFDWTNV